MKTEQAAKDPIQGLLACLALVTTTWILLAGAALVAPRVGNDAAILVALVAAAGLVVVTRPAGPRHSVAPTALLFSVAAGFAGYGACVVMIASVGIGLGMESRDGFGSANPGLALGLAILLVAPVLEELLYRERLLGALREVTAAPLAIVLSSTAFAVPHLEPWQMLGSFLIGIGLGTVYAVSGSVSICVALHVGLNLAGLAAADPFGWTLDPWLGAPLGASLGCLVWWLARVGAERKSRPLDALGLP